MKSHITLTLFGSPRTGYRDWEVVEALSGFLARFGKVAILYGRFSGSAVDPVLYVSWVREELYATGISSERLELLLKGLCLCLGDLECSAFKSVAPGLLAACCSLLRKSDTPIVLLGAILDAIQLLCKVSSAVRDPFMEMVDLILGWGSCPETTAATMPKIRSFFQQISPHWQSHWNHGSELILSMMTDLCNLLDTRFVDSESAKAFLNTASCLVAIFESCAPFLPQSMFAQIPGLVRVMTRALMLVMTLHGVHFSVKDYSEQMAEQLEICLEILIQRQVPQHVLHVMKILTEALEDTQHRPETATGLAQLHKYALMPCLAAKEFQELFEDSYDQGTPLYRLRISHWKPLVESIAQIYQLLMTEGTPSLQKAFVKLFLYDLKGGEVFGEFSVDGDTSGGPIENEDSSSAALKSRGLKFCSPHSLSLKQQLFAITLFFRCVSSERCLHLADSLWNALSDLYRGEIHPLVLLHAVKLQRKIWIMTSPSHFPVIETLNKLMKMQNVHGNGEVSLLLLKWLDEALSQIPCYTQLQPELEKRLLHWLADSESLQKQRAVLNVFYTVLQRRLRISRPADWLSHVFRLASHVDGALSHEALEVVAEAGSLSLVSLDELASQKEGQCLSVALQSLQYSFKSSHVATFLKRLASGTMPGRSRHSSTDWVHSLCKDIAPSLTLEGTSEASMQLNDGLSTGEMAHFLVHEAARYLVTTRFRSIESGPSKLLTLLNERLSELRQYLSENRGVDLFHVWLLLEFLSALQKQIFCGYDGAFYTKSPPQSTWVYYTANKAVFGQRFSRLLYKELSVSHQCCFHCHAAQLGGVYLKMQCKQIQEYQSELDQITAPKQTVIKTRQRPSDQGREAITLFLTQFMDALQMTCLSLIKLSSGACIFGIQHEMMAPLERFLQSIAEREMTGWLQWMQGCASEAEGKLEAATEIYNQQYSYMCELGESLSHYGETDMAAALNPANEAMKRFLTERLTLCYTQLSDWESCHSLKPSDDSLKMQCAEVERLYNQEEFDTGVEKMRLWKEEGLLESSTCADLSLMHRCLVLQLRLNRHRPEISPQVEILSDVLEDRRHQIANMSSSQQRQLLRLMHLSKMGEPTLLLEPFQQSSTQSMDFIQSLLFEEVSKARAVSLLDVDWLRDLAQLGTELGDPTTVCMTALMLAHDETRKQNYSHASKILKSLREAAQEYPPWLQLCLTAETCKLSLQRSNEEEEVCWAVHRSWKALLLKLSEAQEVGADPRSSEILSMTLQNFAQDLEPLPNQPAVTAALSSIEIPDLIHIQHSQGLKAAGLGHLMDGTAPSVAQIQAYCLSLALKWSPDCASAWKQFSQLLLSHKEDTQDFSALLRHAAGALCRCLQLSDPAQIEFEVLMEILSILQQHGELLVEESFMQELLTVPATIWKPIPSQLFSLLNHPVHPVRVALVHLLKGVAQVAPARVLYPVLVEWRREKAKGGPLMPEIQELIQFFTEQGSEMMQDAAVFMDELHRLNSLLSEEWLTLLSDVHVESQIRLGVLSEEAKCQSPDSGIKTADLRSSYGLIMQPLAQSLRKSFIEKRRLFNETPFEKQFWMKFKAKLEALLRSLEAPLAPHVDLRHIQKRWSEIKKLMKEVADEVKLPLRSLDQISPKLAQMRDTGLPMPGVDNPDIQISHLGSQMEILSTKTRPKKLILIGSDGGSYSFLLKGKEELCMDERLLQFIYLMNSFLASPSGPQARVYSVTSLGDHVGLIQWVDQTVSFYALFRQWQHRQQKKLQELNASLSEAKSLPMVMTHHPKDAFQKQLASALREADLPRTTSRSAIPIDILKQVFEKLESEGPKDLLLNEIWGISANSAEQWKKTRRFTQSVALGSVLCYVLGIGDRHLDNMLLDLNTAEVVNIDFNLCFGSGEQLRVPEIVPFRMTHCIQVAMGFGGLHGVFKETFLSGLQILRRHEKPLMTFLESILRDPVMDWSTDRTKRSFQQSLETALHLKLLLPKLDATPIRSYLNIVESIAELSKSFLEASLSCRSLIGKQRSLQEKTEETQKLLTTAETEDQDITTEMQKRDVMRQEALQELHESHRMLEGSHKNTQQWVYRHGQLLMALLNHSDELLLLSEDQWNSACSAQSLNFVTPSAQPAIVNLLFGDHAPESLLPEELMMECLTMDQQRSELDGAREAQFVKLLESLYQHVWIMKELFSEDYLMASYHYKWMKTLEQALSQSSPSVDASVKAPSQQELQLMYQALTGAYSEVQRRIDSGSVILVDDIGKEATGKLSVVQNKLVTSWNTESFKRIFHHLILRCMGLLTAHEADTESPLGFLSDWVKSISGLAQMLRLFRNSQTHQAFLLTVWDVPVSESESVGTGLAWLDAVEKYVSQMALAAERIRNGALIDLQSFLQSGLQLIAKELAESYTQHKTQICSLKQQEQELTTLGEDYDLQKAAIKTELEILNYRLGSELNLSQEEIQSLAQKQHQLTTQLQVLHEEGAEEKLPLDRTDYLDLETEAASQSFLQSLSGMTQHTMRVENEEDTLEMTLSERTWGQMKFPLLHAFLKVIELCEAAESELWPFRANSNLHEELPSPSVSHAARRLEFWMESSGLVASLTQHVHDSMTGAASETVSLESLMEQHFISLVHKRVQPILQEQLSELLTLIQPSQLTPNGSKELETVLEADVELAWECLRVQGSFAYSALMHQSTVAWANGDHPDQETRLHHLAAFESCHATELDADMSHLELYLLKQGHTTAAVPSRQSLMADMKAALEQLLGSQQTMERFETDSETVSCHLLEHLISALQSCADHERAVQVAETMKMLLEGRKGWRQGATAHISGMANIVQTLLQFEYSISRQTWSPGELPAAEEFQNFEMQLTEYAQLREGLQGMEEASVEYQHQLDGREEAMERLKAEADKMVLELHGTEGRLSADIPAFRETAQKLATILERPDQEQSTLTPCLTHALRDWLEELTKLAKLNEQTEELSNLAASAQSLLDQILSQASRKTQQQNSGQTTPLRCLKPLFDEELSIEALRTHSTEIAEEMKSFMEHLKAIENHIHKLIDTAESHTASTMPPDESDQGDDLMESSPAESLSSKLLADCYRLSPASAESDLEARSPLGDSPSLRRPLSTEQLKYAESVTASFKQRLLGSPSLSAEDLTERLIVQATDPNNLCRMYEGWMPWI